MKFNRSGYSLPEVLISVLLVAAIAMAVMSVSVSSKKAGAASNTTLLANEAVRHLSDRLKAFVTADPSCTPKSLGFPRPGGGSCGWQLPGDSYPWALQPNVWHNANNYIPTQLLPYVQSFQYYVHQVPVGNPPSMVSKVQFKLKWNPPQ